MDFDIHQFDGGVPDSDGSEAAFEAFQRALLERFAESPEGQERLAADPDMGFWAAQLMYYGWQYEGSAIGQMTASEVETVVGELFPRKISLRSPEQADDAIPELIAFWKYLKREFHLPCADAVLAFLREVERDFPETMNDPANFGMAKSFFAMGQAAGFDMNTRDGLDAFMGAFNTGLLGRRLLPVPSGLGMAFLDAPSRLNPVKWKAEKKKRKQAEQARKKNRKRGK